MSKQQEALRLALEALKELRMLGMNAQWHDSWLAKPNEAITAIRAALASKSETLADNALERMAENARELGLDYEPIIERVEDAVGMGHNAWDMVKPKELAKAFHEALAEQPAQQEPFGYFRYDLRLDAWVQNREGRPGTPFYTSPPASKPWVGLTEKEKREARNSVSYSPLAMTMGEWTEAVQDATEAKLREKNA